MASDTAEGPAKDTGRFAYLDGIRAVAIGAVVSLHWLSWYSPLLDGGSIGVDVFFVLSAFIITTILWRPPAAEPLGHAWSAFLRRRVVRLYPALLGLVVGSVVLYALVPRAPLAPVEVARRGLRVLTQDSAVWAAGQHGSMWLPALQPFGQTWSLAIEWYFYALWPPVVLLARSRGLGARRLAVGLLVAAGLLYAGALTLSPFWFYFGPPARFAELLSGAALALWLRDTGAGSARPGRLAAPGALAALVAVGGYTLLGAGGHSWLYRGVGVPLAVAATGVLIHTGYRNPDGAVRRLLGHRWPAAVGRASYSLYLWHVVPLLLLEKAVADVPRPALGAAVVAATVALTWLSYRWLERPFLRPRGDVLGPARRERLPAPAASP